jgi:hypothetical protein
MCIAVWYDRAPAGFFHLDTYGTTPEKRYTNKPRQPPLPPRLDSYGLIAAVTLMVIRLLSLLSPLPFSWGGTSIYLYMNIYLLVHFVLRKPCFHATMFFLLLLINNGWFIILHISLSIINCPHARWDFLGWFCFSNQKSAGGCDWVQVGIFCSVISYFYI